jgi:hypothetical protein
VVSTITKSGGNEFSGSFRDSIGNADWIELTPIETDAHPDKVIHVYEGTLGGYAWKDRVWFFGSCRKTSDAPAVGINPTASTVKNTNAAKVNPTVTSFQNTVDEKRYEGKITAQLFPQHSIVASYLDVDKIEANNFFAGTWVADASARWNAPVFCGVCTAEERNNDSKMLKARISSIPNRSARTASWWAARISTKRAWSTTSSRPASTP